MNFGKRYSFRQQSFLGKMFQRFYCVHHQNYHSGHKIIYHYNSGGERVKESTCVDTPCEDCDKRRACVYCGNPGDRFYHAVLKGKETIIMCHCSQECWSITFKALKKRKLKFTCSYCHKVITNLLRCGKCRVIHYCSRECQKADWKEHKAVCH